MRLYLRKTSMQLLGCKSSTVSVLSAIQRVSACQAAVPAHLLAGVDAAMGNTLLDVALPAGGADARASVWMAWAAPAAR